MGFDFAEGVDPELVLIDAIEDVSRRLEAGEPVDLEMYRDRYPEYLGMLRELLPALEFLAVLSEFGYEIFDDADRFDPSV